MTTFIGDEFYPAASACELDSIPLLRYCLKNLATDNLNKYPSNAIPYWSDTNSLNSSIATCSCFQIVNGAAVDVKVADATGDGVTCGWSVTFERVLVSDSDELETKPVIYQFRVRSHCTQLARRSAGGASLQSTITGAFCQPCFVFDNYDDTYDVLCAPYLSNTNSNHNPTEAEHPDCVGVSISLEFEHFNAYSEVGYYTDEVYHPRYRPLHRPLYGNESLCWSQIRNDDGRAMNVEIVKYDELAWKPKSLTQSYVYNYSPKHSAIITGSWEMSTMSRSNHKPQSVYTDSSALSMSPLSIPTVNVSPEYKWRWAESSHNKLSQQDLSSAIRDALHTGNWSIYFLGESHARYNLLHLYYEIEDVTSTVYVWGDEDFGNLHFRWVVFIRNMNARLNSLCEAVLTDGGPVVLVMQTGTWDISRFPLDHLMHSPLSSKALLKTLLSMKTRGCARLIRLVFVETPPYPACALTARDGSAPVGSVNIGCRDYIEGRNNFNIQAFNAHMREMLLRVDYPGLQLVPAFDIILPRALLGEATCDNHFLCGQNVTSPGGIVTLDAIRMAIYHILTYKES